MECGNSSSSPEAATSLGIPSFSANTAFSSRTFCASLSGANTGSPSCTMVILNTSPAGISSLEGYCTTEINEMKAFTNCFWPDHGLFGVMNISQRDPAHLPEARKRHLRKKPRTNVTPSAGDSAARQLYRHLVAALDPFRHHQRFHVVFVGGVMLTTGLRSMASTVGHVDPPRANGGLKPRVPRLRKDHRRPVIATLISSSPNPISAIRHISIRRPSLSLMRWSSSPRAALSLRLSSKWVR